MATGLNSAAEDNFQGVFPRVEWVIYIYIYIYIYYIYILKVSCFIL